MAIRNTGTSAEYVNACDIEYAQRQMDQWRKWSQDKNRIVLRRGESYKIHRFGQKQYHNKQRVDVVCHVCGKKYDIYLVAHNRQQKEGRQPRCKSCVCKDVYRLKRIAISS